jgi:hypothetical protein
MTFVGTTWERKQPELSEQERNDFARQFGATAVAAEASERVPEYFAREVARDRAAGTLSENGHAPWLIDVHDLDAWVDRTKRTLE